MAAGRVEQIILSALLAKYEKSPACLLHPETARQWPSLKLDKRTIEDSDLPGYVYTDRSIRDTYNLAAQQLEQKGLVTLRYAANNVVLARITLVLPQVEQAYAYLGQPSPQKQVASFLQLIEPLAENKISWLQVWQAEQKTTILAKQKLSAEQKKLLTRLEQLVRAFLVYEKQAGQDIAMRVFSIKCYHDSKVFEQQVREDFLTIASKYNEELVELNQERQLKEGQELSPAEKLAFLGIFVRPELYELSGCCQILMKKGSILDLAPSYPFGVGIPGSALEHIAGFKLEGIKQVICIENKTNYDEFLLQEMDEQTIVFYLGGFASQQKRRFLSLLYQSAGKDVHFYLWSDIDLGGFEIFHQLQQVMPGLKPYRMGAEEVERYAHLGLQREQGYLNRLAARQEKYPIFTEVIHSILQHGVTIEQEVFYPYQ